MADVVGAELKLEAVGHVGLMVINLVWALFILNHQVFASISSLAWVSPASAGAGARPRQARRRAWMA
ncbi:hypothetical protein [Streptomyces sp. NBC_01446]|uniref:Uncharacterized protein n=1 Tax=Streptomyces sp. NBC_00119 TaxID=2975659 RepID=A0AAU1UPK9_9ACTN|nr:hypothetical protein [Streptomyces sp. NBC_01446]MCX4647516.1 hypothetical protein [Streptomyces sp. NBC_01446]